MLLQTKDKIEAIQSFINTWLKDKAVYCNNCGLPFIDIKKADGSWDACCETPQLGRNVDFAVAILKQNKMIRQTRKNETASNDDKTMRWGVSMPPMLYQDLESYFQKNYKEKLFKDNKELHTFMKRLPQFCVAERV
jgi:hypothetical protein